MADFSIQPLTTEPVGAKASVSKSNAIPESGQSFGEWLNQSLDTVNKMQKSADASAVKLTTGGSKDIHNTMIAMQKAEIAMNLTMEVRNKIISAYEEIKRMQF